MSWILCSSIIIWEELFTMCISSNLSMTDAPQSSLGSLTFEAVSSVI